MRSDSKEVLTQRLDLYRHSSCIFVKQSHNTNGIPRTFWMSYCRSLVTVSKRASSIDACLQQDFVGYISRNAHSFPPFQWYHCHRSLYCLWTGLLCCHYCCWSYCCGRVVWKIRRIIILLDEDGGERDWILCYRLALHFEHLMLKFVQSFQWQLQPLKHKSYKRLVAKWSHTELS